MKGIRHFMGIILFLSFLLLLTGCGIKGMSEDEILNDITAHSTWTLNGDIEYLYSTGDPKDGHQTHYIKETLHNIDDFGFNYLDVERTLSYDYDYDQDEHKWYMAEEIGLYDPIYKWYMDGTWKTRGDFLSIDEDSTCVITTMDNGSLNLSYEVYIPFNEGPHRFSGEVIVNTDRADWGISNLLNNINNIDSAYELCVDTVSSENDDITFLLRSDGTVYYHAFGYTINLMGHSF